MRALVDSCGGQVTAGAADGTVTFTVMLPAAEECRVS